MSRLKLKIPVPLLLILLSIFAMIGMAYWGAMPLPITLSRRLLCAGIIEVIAITVQTTCLLVFM